MWREWYSAEQIRAAKEAGDAEKVYSLLRWGARADEVEDLLLWAAWEGHSAVAKLLLADGVEVDAKDTHGRTPLHWAAGAGRLAEAKHLLSNGAEVDAKSTAGHTPLHWAALNKSMAVAKILLANGADPNAKDKDGNTPNDWRPELAEIVKQVEAEKAGKKQPAQPKVAAP